MKVLFRCILFTLAIHTSTVHAQNIAINGDGSLPDASAMLDVTSTTRGFLVPRMTTAQQNAIASPAKGLLIYNISTNLFMVNTGTPAVPTWTPLVSGSAGITSLNSLTGTAQTFAVGTANSDFGITSSGTTHTFNLPSASATNRGALTSGDWTNFNNKIGSIILNTPDLIYTNPVGFSYSGGIATGALTLKTQNANLVLAGPATGTAAPTFRSLAPADLNTSAWTVTGNTGRNAATNFIGNIDANDLVFRTNNTERMRILSGGNIGIGTTYPTNALTVVATNPLFLSGLTALTSLASTDSVLTISLGVVKKAPSSLFSGGSGTGWLITGNSGTGGLAGANFIGTTDDRGLVFKVNNTVAGQLGSVNDGGARTSYGVGSSAGSQNATAIGPSATASQNAAVALGYNAQATGQNTVALGPNAIANQVGAIAVGTGAQATKQNAMSYGNGNTASGTNSGALGNNTSVSGDNSLAVGNGTIVQSMNTVAIGSGITVNQANAFILGNPSLSVVGIGTLTPSATSKLSVVGTNPLYLLGVQATSTYPADSILVINGGIVKAAPTGSGAWSTTGNIGTTGNFIGTTNAFDLVLRTNNAERMRILGAVNGTSQPGWTTMGSGTVPRSPVDMAGSFPGKNVLTIQNTRNNGYSSVDMLDSVGTQVGTFGYANPGTGVPISGKNYFYFYGKDFVMSAPGSGTNDFFMQGSSVSANQGFIGINTGAPTERLDVNGNVRVTGIPYPSTDNGYTLGRSSNRWNVVYSTNGFINTSDIRLKKNITPLKYGLKDILKIDPISYSWKTDSTNKVKLGLSAQQLQAVLPDVVNVGTDKDKTLGVNYSDIIPVLINAIKEQNTQIESQQKQINKQQEQIDMLLKELQSIKTKAEKPEVTIK